MLCLSDFELYSRWVPLISVTDDIGLVIVFLLTKKGTRNEGFINFV